MMKMSVRLEGSLHDVSEIGGLPAPCCSELATFESGQSWIRLM